MIILFFLFELAVFLFYVHNVGGWCTEVMCST